MSLKHQVAEAVHRRGRATLDDLQHDCLGFSRKQISNALDNARRAGRVKTLERGPAGPALDAGRTVYGPADNAPQPLKKATARKRPKPSNRFPSVFHLADGQLDVPWPPNVGTPSLHALQGAWD